VDRVRRRPRAGDVPLRRPAGYFSYLWTRGAAGIAMDYSCSAEKARLRFLLPSGAMPFAVTVDGKPVQFQIERAGGSDYAAFDAPAFR